MNPFLEAEVKQRINLQLEQNTKSAQGFGQHVQGTAPGVIDAFPAQELYRAEDREEPRDWEQRWQDAGGTIYGGRMIAMKADPVWEKISAFGVAWPPYDYGSGMWVRDIDREEAVALGLMQESDQVPTPAADFGLGVPEPELKETPTAHHEAIGQINEQLEDFVPENLRTAASLREDCPAQFRSSPLSQLWKEVGDISHPQHPFLDLSYSPNSLMPAADYSPWVADRLGSGDWESILELLTFIANAPAIAGVHRTFHSRDYAEFIEAEPALLQELKAIAILTYRIQWTGDEDSRISLLAELFEHSLACYPFAVRAGAIAHLLDGANQCVDASPAILSRLPETAAVFEALRGYPTTFRACISYSLERGSPITGTLRPQSQGHYGLRQFGLSARQNAHFFASCGIFEPPSDLSILANRLSKEELLRIAEHNGGNVTKSWKKSRIIEYLLSVEGARTAIGSRAAENLVQFCSGIRPAFDAWRERVSLVGDVAHCLARA